LRSPELYPSQPSLSILIAKEWRDILAGHTVWILLLLLSALVGYSYVQAAALYAEASRSAIEHPEVARGLSPLDGIFVPTFGALYLANTFLFPFIAIRTIAGEKQTGSLKLLLQLPCNFSIVILAKVVVLATVWSGMAVICLTAVALWAWSGGHIGHCELANLLAGHFLYAAVVAGLALLAAALAESGATAAILTLAALGFLGYGIQPTEAAEWGYDIQRAVSDASSNIWWTGMFPGLAIVLLVTGITLLGEGLNETLNPVLRKRVKVDVEFPAADPAADVS